MCYTSSLRSDSVRGLRANKRNSFSHTPFYLLSISVFSFLCVCDLITRENKNNNFSKNEKKKYIIPSEIEKSGKNDFLLCKPNFIQRVKDGSLMICAYVKMFAEQGDKSSRFHLFYDHSAPYRRISQESGNNGRVKSSVNYVQSQQLLITLVF